MKSIMDSWIKQKGYPVVTIKASKLHHDKHRAEKIMEVTQERFLIDSSLNRQQRKNEIGDKKWYIPLTYITQDSDIEHTFWINHTSRRRKFCVSSFKGRFNERFSIKVIVLLK